MCGGGMFPNGCSLWSGVRHIQIQYETTFPPAVVAVVIRHGWDGRRARTSEARPEGVVVGLLEDLPGEGVGVEPAVAVEIGEHLR